MAINPVGTDAYVTNEAGDTVSVLALTSTPPGPPGRPIAVDGDHRATVSVSATTGATPISYTVTAVDFTDTGHGGQTCTVHGVAGPCTLIGLTSR